MSRFFICSLFLFMHNTFADTIKSYMGIALQIPQMEIKADPQSQAWARSARHVLTITSESIAETLVQANEIAARQGAPIFCMPSGVQLGAMNLNEIIQQTYKEMSPQQNDKDSLTVSQVAWMGVVKQFPCKTATAAQHEMALINNAWNGKN